MFRPIAITTYTQMTTMLKTVGTNWATVLLAPTAFTRSCW